MTPEVERYELSAPPVYEFALDRRAFLKAVGGGIVVLLALGEESTAAPRGHPRRRGGGGGGYPRSGSMPREIGAWLHLDQDGQVTAYSGKAEVGQNIRTSLAQAVAEELRLPAGSVRMVLGDTGRTPFDAGTFGSRTTPAMAAQLRRVAAAARETLIDLAAAEWKTDRAGLTIGEGRVRNPASGASLTYAQLTKGQQLAQVVPESAPTTPADRWQVAGKPAPKAEARAFVTGAHRFTSDVTRPGMVHGKVLRPDRLNATLVSFDGKGAEAMPGVVEVRDGDFIGVTAPSEPLAARAMAALRAEWKAEPQPSAADLFAYLKQNPAEGRGGGGGGAGQPAGSVDDGLAAASAKLSQTYTVAYIAHAPLEPRAAVAEWEGDRLTVWTGTQRPFGVRGELAQAFRIADGQVRVIVPDTGAGYGGKHSGECAVEAARLARAAGKPVKLVWTREEEFTWAYFRPAGVIEIRAGAAADGTLTAWEHQNWNSGGSALRSPYECANQRTQFHGARSPLRQGSYRALAATANTFARETALDELAHALKQDPLAFRLKNLREPRLLAVLSAAEERFGWGKSSLSRGRGFGLACGTEKGSYVATCAEVEVHRGSGKVRVLRAVTAFECGAVVNPRHLQGQVEGCVIQGLGGALFEAIDFADGKILNPRFSRYRVPCFSDVPVLETVLLDRKDLPSAGAGETPIIAIAPAVGSAIFMATGVRLRSLPLAPNGVKA